MTDLTPGIHRGLTSTDVERMIDGANVVRIPVDPQMHQKPGALYAPVSTDVIRQILANVHISARYDVKVTCWGDHQDDVIVLTITGMR